jgi:hypothetical protein
LSTYFCAFIFLDCGLICLLSGQSLLACYWVLHLFELSWPLRHTHIHKTTRTKKHLFFSTRFKTLWGPLI